MLPGSTQPAWPLPALQEGQFLLPGFIDTHLHAPQYAYTGTGTHIPLMEWLDTVRGSTLHLPLPLLDNRPWPAGSCLRMQWRFTAALTLCALQLTFPTESSFKDNADLARDVYTKVWRGAHALCRTCKVLCCNPPCISDMCGT